MRYTILDGYRGVAALLVLLFHLFEAIAFANGDAEQHFYHGFLAVDFFFLLSGFVMGYAYDNRWDEMTVKDFCKRRLIRLHPMAVVGVILGIVAFVIQGCTQWDGTRVGIEAMMICTLLALFMLPSPAGIEVRGNAEAFPLNGPHWSLFFEYIGSIMYALMLRKMSTKQLRIWVEVSFFLLFFYASENGTGYANGWSSEPMNLLGGFLRMSFAYPAGMLMSRLFIEDNPEPTRKPVFLIGSVALCLLLAVPSLSTLTGWKDLNVLYELLCVGFLFRVIIGFGARGVVEGTTKKVAEYLGQISYPLYAIHYPSIYLYIHWISTGNYPLGLNLYTAPVVIAIVNVVLATLLSKYYDIPFRQWLTKK